MYNYRNIFFSLLIAASIPQATRTAMNFSSLASYKNHISTGFHIGLAGIFAYGAYLSFKSEQEARIKRDEAWEQLPGKIESAFVETLTQAAQEAKIAYFNPVIRLKKPIHTSLTKEHAKEWASKSLRQAPRRPCIKPIALGFWESCTDNQQLTYHQVNKFIKDLHLKTLSCDCLESLLPRNNARAVGFLTYHQIPTTPVIESRSQSPESPTSLIPDSDWNSDEE